MQCEFSYDEITNKVNGKTRISANFASSALGDIRTGAKDTRCREKPISVENHRTSLTEGDRENIHVFCFLLHISQMIPLPNEVRLEPERTTAVEPTTCWVDQTNPDGLLV